MAIKESQRQWLAIIFLVVVGFLLYANSFNNKMFWDDNDNVLNNQYIKDWRYFPRYFSENLIAGAGQMSNYWRPLLLTVFSLEWKLWGAWPAGYHFVNTSFHIANALLLFWLLFSVFKNRGLAFLTAAIFLIHPLGTEAVTYVSGLADPLSVFFILLGLVFWLKKESYLSFLMFVSALLSKETAIVMPALVFLVEIVFRHPSRNQKERLKAAIKSVWPFLAIAFFYIFLRATVLNFINSFNLYNETNVFTGHFYIRLFTFFKVLLTYFGLLFWPVNLHMERTLALAGFLFEPRVFFGGILLLSLLILALLYLKNRPVVSFGIFWFFICLFPTSNLLIPVSGLLYEHWLYLASAGIFLVVLQLGFWISARHRFLKLFLAAALLIFLVFLGRQTIARNTEWKDPITFYNQTLKYAPSSYRVVNNLGMAYADQNDKDNAEKMYRLAISLDPENPVAYHNLGNLYRMTGKNNLAAENFKKAINLNPKFFFSYPALVDLYLKEKNYREAIAVLEKYQKQYPQDKEVGSIIQKLKESVGENP